MRSVSANSLFTTIAALAVLAGSAGCTDPPAAPVLVTAYERDARGQHAFVERTVVVTAAEGSPLGLVSPGSICDGHLYLADSKNATVHVIRLADGLRVRTIGGRDEGAIYRLTSPTSALADCSNDVLYVVESRKTFQFRLSSGEGLAQVDTPMSAGPSLERPLLDGDAPIFAGLWTPSRDLLSGLNGANALAGFAIGYRFKVPLESNVEALLPLVSTGCRSISSSCVSVNLDKWEHDDGGWIACQGGGASDVGVYSRLRVPQRQIDVRSPFFVADGTSTRMSDDIPTKIAWHQRNSAVKFCGVFGPYVVTAHYVLEPGEWSPGTAMPPRVYLNVHKLDGAPVMADVRIRDFPVAKDEQRLYMIAYEETRKTDGGRLLQMDAIRIIDDAGNLVFRPV